MLKSITICLISLSGLVFATGCATYLPLGVVYTEVDLPVAATANQRGPKKGTSTCKSVLTLLAFGDASIEAAAKNGGITNITHVDWSAENILGIYGVYTVTVYGD